MSKTYYLYTDGACQPNPGVGGWAFLLRHESSGREIEISASGGITETTNNRMELQSVIEGLTYFADNIYAEGDSIVLFSDSEYVVNGLNKWCDSWEARGWKKANNDPVLNPDMWAELFVLRNQVKPRCVHVKGHDGHEFNERVDALAVRAAKRVKSHE